MIFRRKHRHHFVFVSPTNVTGNFVDTWPEGVVGPGMGTTRCSCGEERLVNIRIGR